MSKQTEAGTSTSTTGEKYDCIIVGAGHNGLATGLVLARNGQKVLVLEKNNYVGGMGGTREILKGCRNEVGASCLFPLSAEDKIIFRFRIAWRRVNPTAGNGSESGRRRCSSTDIF